MPRLIYNKSMIEFVRNAYQTHTASEIPALFKKRFGFERTTSQIKAMLNKHGITTKRKQGDALKGRLKLLTQEQHDFVEDAYKRMTIANITKAINSKFGLKLREGQIRSYTRNHKMKSGRTGRFEQGHETWNAGMKGWQAGGRSVETQFKPRSINPDYRAFNQVEIGTEVVDADGYRKRKIAQPSTWEYCHLLLWREHHGEVPDSHVVRFLDNDKTNITIENLVLVSRGAHAVLNKQTTKLHQFESQVRPVVATVAEVRVAMSRKLNA